ncbi:porin family protein [Cytophagaceae bacterium DM2B3-1]|uniref:Porin family protein n=2 Tax=Xanthocytophaga TaxID=3078918 RepID=A0ABT7CQ46_9BACT|nr:MULTISPECIES: porin family protein [Xanthocytophaga]MDJ1495870.1 porin family protein [Xanthocytophaga flavus]MDJ1505434.1 porin family protein [Xanthocytophaga agilis]
MKKILFSFIAFLGVFVCTYAQVEVRYGIRGGMNLSSWQGETMQSISDLLGATDGAVTTQSRVGFHAGGYAAIKLSDYFTLEPGLQYSLKGTELTGRLNGNSQVIDFLNVNTTFRVQSHYIEMPILAKVYLAEGFHLFAGPQVSYLVDNKVHVRASVLGISAFNRTLDINNGFQKWDFSGVAGIGYRFVNGVNIMAAYDYGFQRLDENKRFNTYNRTIKFSIGYEF